MKDVSPYSREPETAPSQPYWLIQTIRLLAVSGFLLGLYSVWSRYFIFTDGTVYATLGKNLASGVGLRYCGGAHLFYPPGYPLAIAAFYFLLRNAELASHLVSFLAYMGSIIIMARLAWMMRPSPVFTLSAIVVIMLHPYFLLYASYVMSESLFAFIVLSSSLCAWKIAVQEKSPVWLWCLWGALGGYAYLIRADGVIYWPLQSFFIIAAHWCASRRLSIHAVIRGSIAAIIFIGVMFPYLNLIAEQTGQWQLSTKTAILLEFSRMKMNDDSAQGETRQTSRLSEDGKSFAIDKAKDTLGSFLINNPRQALDRVLWNWNRLLHRNGLVFSWLTIPPFGILAWILRSRIINLKSLFLILHTSPIIIFSLFYIDQRFILAFIPFFALAYARAFEWLFGGVRSLSKRNIIVFILPAVLVSSILATPLIAPRMINMARKVFASDLPLEHKMMGSWMKQNLSMSPTTRITHRNPWVSFYAEGCHKRTPGLDISLPEEDRLSRLVKWCQEMGVKYLIVDQRMTLPYMPEYIFLLEDDRSREEIKHIKTISSPNPRIVLYEIEQ